MHTINICIPYTYNHPTNIYKHIHISLYIYIDICIHPHRFIKRISPIILPSKNHLKNQEFSVVQTHQEFSDPSPGHKGFHFHPPARLSNLSWEGSPMELPDAGTRRCPYATWRGRTMPRRRRRGDMDDIDVCLGRARTQQNPVNATNTSFWLDPVGLGFWPLDQCFRRLGTLVGHLLTPDSKKSCMMKGLMTWGDLSASPFWPQRNWGDFDNRKNNTKILSQHHGTWWHIWVDDALSTYRFLGYVHILDIIM